MGFGTSPRTVAVLSCRQGVNHQLAHLGQELEHTTAELDLARADLARTQEQRDVVLQQADRVQPDLLASRSQLHRLRHRAKKACALLLCLGSVGGFAAGWGGANWQQANSGTSTPLVSEVPRR